MPRYKFPKGNTFASKDHKELIAQSKTPEERQAKKTLLKNKIKSLTVAEVLEEKAEEIVSKCIALALSGDSTCMKLCMERLLPPRRFIQMESKIDARAILAMFPVAQEVGD
ncbi:MAG: hypothetical protein ACYDIC_14305 [Desulfobaccales bacterium]